MKYLDTIEQADGMLQKTLGFLKQHRLPANPINYGVVYEYMAETNKDISKTLDRDLKAGKTIDSFLMESLYKDFILQQDAKQEAIVDDVHNVVSTTQKHATKAHKDTSNYISILDEGMSMLDREDTTLSKQVIDRLIKISSSMKNSQTVLLKALRQAQAKTAELQQQIDEYEESKQIDQLTGLFNRSVLNQTVDMWVSNDVQNIAAIAINLDHFKQFNDNYGVTIGNVILSKVAQKVKSYVADSGLPVRTGGEEFLIMIPEADVHTAGEIAEKVRQGVEKLQFVNAKNRQRLPKVTVSLGVTSYNPKIGIEGTLQKATSAMRMAKATGRNRVFTDS
ncbi:GGDEF domain-containing protein [Psychrosphaera sp. B3R10]|uniref:GGDEF domain-containing protein n=1 Tax=unclassified Psychrosphaera TaxID=2641570 RepID=UPI001C09BBA7|nr:MULTISPECIES: GGDEF domain-containing protein [unclassified Psychrosphaera]MBU2880602.1 GGDEF domain-containing protein [Psychrosphaera sp. I2R16]MBU2990688.1 GGDEF domain-containing protein [Psychrosphaera sp. B3R10]